MDNYKHEKYADIDEYLRQFYLNNSTRLWKADERLKLAKDLSKYIEIRG